MHTLFEPMHGETDIYSRFPKRARDHVQCRPTAAVGATTRARSHTHMNTNSAGRRPLSERTPRLVYSFFYYSFRICYSVGLSGYLLILLDFFSFPALLGFADKVASLEPKRPRSQPS